MEKCYLLLVTTHDLVLVQINNVASIQEITSERIPLSSITEMKVKKGLAYSRIRLNLFDGSTYTFEEIEHKEAKGLQEAIEKVTLSARNQ